MPNYNLYVDDPGFSQFQQDVQSGKTKVDKLNFSSPALKPPALATPTLTPAQKQASNNFDPIDYSAGFDAMAGYDKAKSAYLDELGRNKKRFNYGKAVSKFDEMWKANEGNRLTQYRRTNMGKRLDDLIADNRAKLFDIQESARQDIAELQQKNDLTNSQIVADAPSATEPPFNTAYWTQEANRLTGGKLKTIEDVKKWQTDNGLTPDGKFGKLSAARWDELNNQLSKDYHAKNGPGADFSRQDKNGIGPDNALIVVDKNGNTSYAKNYYGPGMIVPDYNVDTSVFELVPSVTKSIRDQNEQMYGSTDEYDSLTPFQQRDFSNWRKMNGGKGTVIDYKKAKGIKMGKYYQGGQLSKFQQGGVAQGGILQQITQLPKEQQQQIMQAFAKWAQAKGIDVNQLQGNESALEQAMTAFMQEMQNKSQAARLGAKINYIRQLKGGCPEGEELVYFKKGGKVCKECIKSEKCGGKAKKHEDGDKIVKEYKTRKACGGFKTKLQGGGSVSDKALNDSIQKYNKPYPKGFTYKQKVDQERKLEQFQAEQEKRKNKKEKEKKSVQQSCKGSKMKKHLLGGIIGL